MNHSNQEQVMEHLIFSFYVITTLHLMLSVFISLFYVIGPISPIKPTDWLTPHNNGRLIFTTQYFVILPELMQVDFRNTIFGCIKMH